MKDSKTQKKLSLRKSTVSNLMNMEMAKVRGGEIWENMTSTPDHCNCNTRISCSPNMCP